MNKDVLALTTDLVPKSYIDQGESALNARRKLIKSLLSQRCLPKDGWDESSIEHFVQVTRQTSRAK